MVPSFRAFIPVPSIHGTNGGKSQHMAPSSSESRCAGNRDEPYPLGPDRASPLQRKMMILLSEGAMWPAGAFPRFSPAWDYFAADSIVSPSCVISTDSTLTSLPLALKLGPSILVTQAL